MVGSYDNGYVTKLSRQTFGGGGHVSRTHSVNIEDIVSIKALMLAWQKFSRRKKSRADVDAYQKNLRQNLNTLHQRLRLGDYRHQPYEPFTVCDPKKREIHKATVADRVVHQAVVSAIEPLFECRFIYDSYSCRRGKGTHMGIRRLRSFLRQASHNNTAKVYVLKCDIRKYFASIDHEILLGLIIRIVEDESVVELIRTIILSHGAEYGRGIPLGNVTSQLFANIYLHELDWFMKQSLGIRFYGRYCDDFIIVSADKDYLTALIKPISMFLLARLGLDLHPDKVILRSWERGVDFLGYVLRPHTTTLRKRTKKRIISRITQSNKSSYLGICKHAQTYHFSQVIKLVVWDRDGGATNNYDLPKV